MGLNYQWLQIHDCTIEDVHNSQWAGVIPTRLRRKGLSRFWSVGRSVVIAVMARGHPPTPRLASVYTMHKDSKWAPWRTWSTRVLADNY